MQYLDSHSGGLRNEAVRIPNTLNHISQFLYHCKDEHWGHLQKIAGDALAGKIQFEDKIKPTDLSGLLKSIQDVREKVAGLKIPEETDLGPLNKSIRELEKKIADLGKAVNAKMADLNQSVAIVQKENQLQDILIEEIKEASNNPLAN